MPVYGYTTGELTMSQYDKRHAELMSRHAAIVSAMRITEDFDSFMKLNEMAKQVMIAADACREASKQSFSMKYSSEGYVCDSMSLPRAYRH